MILEKVESQFRPREDGKYAAGRGGMVSSAFPEASRAGAEILREGGNAVDAACATAFALCVCEPQASGIGGQSLAIMHLNDKTIAIDGSSVAPSLAHISRFESGQRASGYRATTVPSTPAVLAYMNFRHGKLPLRRVLEPAIRIAREGYRITELQSFLQRRDKHLFERVSSGSGMRAFYKEGGEPYAPGDLFRQPELAAVLEAIARDGVKAFYHGDIAHEIDEDMRRHDGFLRLDDLALIPWPVERKPISRRYRRVSVATLPPPRRRLHAADGADDAGVLPQQAAAPRRRQRLPPVGGSLPQGLHAAEGAPLRPRHLSADAQSPQSRQSARARAHHP